jgi:hypothetical protein
MIRAWASTERWDMPLLRYFVFVGGALLALLLISDVVLPQVPLPGNLTSGSDLPAVRIRSQQKWPERVVIDTTVPLPATAVKVAKAEAASPPQPSIASASAKSSVREAFAQLPPGQAEQKQQTPSKIAAMAPAEPGKAQVKPQPKRKVARARPVGRPMMMVAQQPHFGLFDSTW